MQGTKCWIGLTIPFPYLILCLGSFYNRGILIPHNFIPRGRIIMGDELIGKGQKNHLIQTKPTSLSSSYTPTSPLSLSPTNPLLSTSFMKP